MYEACHLCPRNCGAPRTAGPAGFCHEPAVVRAGVACLHFGEEPPITVHGGSGTIFISGCNLGCAFCQNYQISQQGMGADLNTKDFAKVCLALEAAGAENINIVTGSHTVPAIVAGLTEARLQGMSLPICWNSSAYEKVEVLQQLQGLVDIWLPDFKTINPETSAALFKSKDYPQRAQESILFMVENSPLKL
ncbi:MAG: radical SAM protein, partial [Spirochaetaceae bacterium]|nr:radical SAM protein [Spirochaetaceae bacterium]